MLTPEQFQEIKERLASRKSIYNEHTRLLFEAAKGGHWSDEDCRFMANTIREPTLPLIVIQEVSGLVDEAERLQSQLTTALQDISRLTAENTRLKKQPDIDPEHAEFLANGDYDDD